MFERQNDVVVSGFLQTNDSRPLKDAEIVGEVSGRIIPGSFEPSETGGAFKLIAPKIEGTTISVLFDCRSRLYTPHQITRLIGIDGEGNNLRLNVELERRKIPENRQEFISFLNRVETGIAYIKSSETHPLLADIWLRCLQDDRDIGSSLFPRRNVIGDKSDSTDVQRLMNFVQSDFLEELRTEREMG